VGHRVLVCDDAIFMRTMITDILSGAGYEVVGERKPAFRPSSAIASSTPISSPWTS